MKARYANDLILLVHEAADTDIYYTFKVSSVSFNLVKVFKKLL